MDERSTDRKTSKAMDLDASGLYALRLVTGSVVRAAMRRKEQSLAVAESGRDLAGGNDATSETARLGSLW